MNQSKDVDHKDPNRIGGGSPIPAISLPKGGGAVRGIGEKFAANPVTGTGSMTVPITTTPGRSGLSPALTLAYDSGAGNGPFGLGWSLSIPAITRKTDKGIPRYQDGEESDVFILSGAEDLVPVLIHDGGQWKPEIFERSVGGTRYSIKRYRPRIEGLFSRVERWTRINDGDIHWRSISRDNLLTIYGKNNESRIADPQDDTRIYSWLICESRDDKGNAIAYEYAAEDAREVNLKLASEKNRGDKDSPIRKANRYPKRILYGNRTSLLDADGIRRPFLTDELKKNANWMFEVAFDYGDEDYVELPEDDQKRTFVEASLDKNRAKPWPVRSDPFSSYRSGFEVRTYRLCHRVLMFHHFKEELGLESYLVRSTELYFTQTPIASFMNSVAHSGYIHQADGKWLKRSLPQVEFNYSEAVIEGKVRELDSESIENLPTGLDGSTYQWIDLDGDGAAGILTEQAGAWFYKRNLSPKTIVIEDNVEHTVASLGPIETAVPLPSLKGISAGGMQFLDLAGDGRPDLAQLNGPSPGFYEHEEDGGWTPHRPFKSLPQIDWRDPNLKFIDLTGDGHADILISEDCAFIWYPSLAEDGFGASRHVQHPLDEETGPRLIFADAEQSIHLADLSGDGLTDIVRIRNREICYWPNLGYGNFGPKVTMDHAPWFDRPDQFDHRRIRLADIDGSGVTDIIYLHGEGVRLYFNQSGNSWSEAKPLPVFPPTDNLSSVTAVDLLGNGTACLVWSSVLPRLPRRSMCYVDMMGGQKPHLLISSRNNLGAETRVHYSPSTKFYLEDKYKGKPWVTKLPFPVHVVDRVETDDQISNNRFVTRYAYHHGYFDGEEREFRGFGMVEQQDTEELAALTADGELPAANFDPASHVPPVLTRTWFHTGAFLDGQRISKQFEHEYYREGDASDKLAGLTDEQLRAQSLVDTVLPSTIRATGGARLPYFLAPDEILEACRSLKGSILRQEVYALDGGDESDRPYTVSEHNYTIELLQPRGGKQHAVFFTHAREQIDFHYERKLIDVNGTRRADPRVSHEMTLEVDGFGNALRAIAIGYRRRDLPGLNQPEQKETHLVLSANRFANRPGEAYWYRVGVPVESSSFEIVKPPDPQIADTHVVPFSFETIASLAAELFPTEKTVPESTKLWPYEKWDWRNNSANAPQNTRLRLIEQGRTIYRKDKLNGLLELGDIESLLLPGETYKLALTPGLIASVFKRKQGGSPPEDLLPNPAPLLEGKGEDQGGYVSIDGGWWVPSGQVFFSTDPNHSPDQELAFAKQHFFLAHRFQDPFGRNTIVEYDKDRSGVEHNLLVTATRDALGNEMRAVNDYRVLQPTLITDPNRNRSAAGFDALGRMVATAVMGKVGQSVGDLLEGFDSDPPVAVLQSFVANPRDRAGSLLGSATMRIVYDLERFQRCAQPPFAAALSRDTHFLDPGGAQTKIQINFSYSDGFGREIQKKAQAESGDAPRRQIDVLLPSGDTRPGELALDANNAPLQANAPQRWVGSGRTVFDNKGNPVKQYDPFFSSTHLYEDEREMTDTGVSLILFYDPVGRVIATLHPNHSYEKIVFDAWRQASYDVNDTVAPNETETGDPRTDKDIKGYLSEYFKAQPNDWQTWRAARIGNQMGAAERDAAQKASAHANTPRVSHLDSQGRTFLTITDNGPDPAQPGKRLLFATRVPLDIEGNQREVRDSRNRVVMRSDYDLLSTRIHQPGMESGEGWTVNDVTGKPIRAWDSRGFIRRMTYDALRRPTGLFVLENGVERLAERTVYGESLGDNENHRTRVHQVFDGAGVLTSDAYDFKGNLLRTRRELLPEYKQDVNWLQNPAPNDGAFFSSTTYDALNRPLTVTTPDGSVYRATISVANLIDRVDVNLRGAGVSTAFVTNINYNAKGARELIAYGNGARTTHEYDPLTSRLTRLMTTRPANPELIASQLFKNSGVVQDLRYTYDPAGNITRIEDAALKTIINNGEQGEAVCEYTYDSLYRLTEARGREHIGQTAFDFNPPNGNRRDFPFFGTRANPNDMQAIRNYTERYEYDEVGNFKFTRHSFNGGGWNRSYDYEEASLLEPGKVSNRLTRTIASGFTETYTYKDASGQDINGCMTSINAMKMVWDFEDQLRQVDLGGGGTAYYVYDAGGQRVRKVIENQNGSRKEERIYLGGFEIYREYNANGTSVTLARESIHIMDEHQRVALVETKTIENQASLNSPVPLQRYQLGNHLGSAALELGKDSALISYEEYHPYGTTALQVGPGGAEVPVKRYRYTGKERDEETGLYYHGARYYAAWLARWVSCDPVVSQETANLYAYGSNSPLRFIDPDGMTDKDLVGGLLSQVEQSYNKLKIRTFADLGDVGKYAKQGRSRYLNPILRVARLTEAEHPIPGAAARRLNPDYVYRNARTIIIERPVAVAKTAGDLRLIKAVKNGTMGAAELATRAKANFVKAVATHWAQTGGSSSATMIKEARKAAQVTEESALEALPTLSKTVGSAAKTESGVATVATTAVKAESVVAKAAPLLSKAAPALAKTAAILKPLAPAAKFLGKAAPWVGAGVAALEVATAKTQNEKVDAGISVAGAAIGFIPHPVAKAASVGIAGGQLLEKTLDVSDYSSAVGMKADQAVGKLGGGEGLRTAAGVTATILATPTSVTVAVIDKASGGRFAKLIGLR